MSAIRRTLVAGALVVSCSIGFVGLAGAAKVTDACKLLKPAKVAKVLGASAAVDPDAAGDLAPGVESCAFDVGPGLGEDGGALVVLTYYSGALADNIASEFEARATSLGRGVVWEPMNEVAYVVKKGKLVGVGVTYTSETPPATELQDEMARLVRVAAKRA